MKAKVCTKCKRVKPETSFNRDTRNSKEGRRARCKLCENIYERARRKQFKKEFPLIAKKQEFKYNLKSKYGLTVKEYQQMFETQQGCCAVCGISQSKLSHRLCVEHSHKSGKVRQLTCKTCNHLIDIYETRFYSLKNEIVDYLERNDG